MGLRRKSPCHSQEFCLCIRRAKNLGGQELIKLRRARQQNKDTSRNEANEQAVLSELAAAQARRAAFSAAPAPDAPGARERSSSHRQLSFRQPHQCFRTKKKRQLRETRIYRDKRRLNY